MTTKHRVIAICITIVGALAAPWVHMYNGGSLANLAAVLNQSAFWLLFFAGLLLHEVLHMLGLMAFGIPNRQLQVVLNLKEFQVAVRPMVPVPVEQYRVALLLPLVFLGLFPTILTSWLQSEYLAMFAATMVAICFFDIEDYYKLSTLGQGERVVVTSKR